MRAYRNTAYAATVGRQAARASSRARVAWAGAGIGGLWGLALATQYLAARLVYHPHLGPWLYRAPLAARASLQIWSVTCLVTAVVVLLSRRVQWTTIPLGLAAFSLALARNVRVYSPLRIFAWYAAYHKVTAYRGLFIMAWSIRGLVAVTIALVALAAARRFFPDEQLATRWMPGGPPQHPYLALWGAAHRGWTPAAPLPPSALQSRLPVASDAEEPFPTTPT